MTIREEICRTTKRLYDRGLIGPSEGNVSVRMESGTIISTPKAIDKARLSPEDLAELHLDGSLINGDSSPEPSSEIKMHLRIYRERRDCNAIVHAHPIFATGLATAGKSIPDDVLPESGYYLGRVALVPFAIPGTDAVGDAIAPFAKDHKTFLLQNHGAVTIGATLDDAYMRMEILERVAKTLFVADACGGPHKLSQDAMAWLKKVGLSGEL
jgi:L-fuculose-phosphate aldolase